MFKKKEKGAAVIEYGILASLVGLLSVGAAYSLGGSVENGFENSGSSVGSAVQTAAAQANANASGTGSGTGAGAGTGTGSTFPRSVGTGWCNTVLETSPNVFEISNLTSCNANPFAGGSMEISQYLGEYASNPNGRNLPTPATTCWHVLEQEGVFVSLDARTRARSENHFSSSDWVLNNSPALPVGATRWFSLSFPGIEPTWDEDAFFVANHPSNMGTFGGASVSSLTCRLN